ncbi:MAG: DUF3800 domain-containing protein [Solirubrobacterales bacterium]|nr:DUF3800 domain-containing protein [Solirubrobacterales bacterium]
MYLLFLDESGKPEDGVFALGGVAIRADRWREVKERWELCLDQSGWPREKELKWSGTQTGEVPPDVADAVYGCLSGLPVQALVTILYPEMGDPEIREKFFSGPDATYDTALTFIAERYQRFLAHENGYGAIVLDSRQFEADNHMRRYFDRIHTEGTEFSGLDRIIDGLLLGPSHHSLGLQLADLVVGPTRAAKIRLGDASRYFSQLDPLFMRHPVDGELDGTGLKIFPRDSRPADENRLFDPR